VEDAALDNNLSSCHCHVLIVPSLLIVVASLLCSCCHSHHAALSSSPMLIVTSLPYHRCCHCHIIVLQSPYALMATVAVPLLPQLLCCCIITNRHHHHMNGPALNGCKEIRKTINTTNNTTLQSQCCHKLHIMASSEQQGVSDLNAAVGCKPGHVLHKNID